MYIARRSLSYTTWKAALNDIALDCLVRCQLWTHTLGTDMDLGLQKTAVEHDPLHDPLQFGGLQDEPLVGCAFCIAG